MKILVIRSVSTEVGNEKNREYLRAMAFSGTEVEVISLDAGPASVETCEDVTLAEPEILKVIEKAEGYSAIIINCFLDPALEAARDLTDTLVLGAGETSMTMASMLGRRFAVLSVMDEEGVQVKAAAKKYGLLDKLAYAVGIEIPVLEIESSPDMEKEIIKHSEIALEKGAEVLVTGCTGLIDFARIMSERFDVPVIEPAAATFKMAEALGSLRR